MINKFNQVYYKLIMESSGFGKPGSLGEIPRPNRMKTPPNDYGSTGGNAKYYDLYIQDEAQGVFVDKYGNEKGHNAWWGIIGVGNAMWKACDEILGQRRTMSQIVDSELNKLKLKEQCTDFQYDPGWIVSWTWWILLNIINGKKYTADFISDCIPTFKGVKHYFPITTEVLLQKAGIDVDNYKLSKKIQAKRDAEAAAEEQRRQEEEQRKQKEEQKRIQHEKDLKNRQIIAKEFVKACKELHIYTPETINLKYFNDNGSTFQRDYRYKALSLIFQKEVDVSVGIKNLLRLPEPTNKDEQRIYDIVIKCNENKLASIFGLNKQKAVNFAWNMNNKITDEAKRENRRQAAQKYGLSCLAHQFDD